MVKFFKYHSNGNDFIILDNLDGHLGYLFKNSKIIERLCKREFSIGADGLILLQKSKIADFKMTIFNSDGFEADMCGNGLLCLRKFINDFIDKKKLMTIETKAQNYKTVVNLDEISFISKLPKILKEGVKISLDETNFSLQMLNSGVLHGVIFTKNIDDINVFEVGRKIRYLKNFNPGINVNFCEIINENKINVRTYEKGVENETFCCSTGALAVSYFHFFKNKNVKNLVLLFKGGEIKTSIEKDEIKLSAIPIFAYTGYIESI